MVVFALQNNVYLDIDFASCTLKISIQIFEMKPRTVRQDQSSDTKLYRWRS